VSHNEPIGEEILADSDKSGFCSFFYLDPVATTALTGVLATTDRDRAEASARGWDAPSRRAAELVGP
jgi:hypothetical protein